MAKTKKHRIETTLGGSYVETACNYYDGCGWTVQDNGMKGYLGRAARKHSEETGHDTVVYHTRSTHYTPISDKG